VASCTFMVHLAAVLSTMSLCICEWSIARELVYEVKAFSFDKKEEDVKWGDETKRKRDSVYNSLYCLYAQISSRRSTEMLSNVLKSLLARLLCPGPARALNSAWRGRNSHVSNMYQTPFFAIRCCIPRCFQVQ
jgi:hypothetical protein